MSKKLQKWVDKTYKKEKAKNIDISEKQSNGSLKIEGFTLLENISLKNSKLISLRIINCPQLDKIDLLKLTSDLLISRCPKLTEVKFSDCHIENLFVSDCPKLTKLDCSHSQLTNLDLSGHNLLSHLNCSGNNLTELSVSNLTELDCPNNKIKYLNLNLCPEIVRVNCSNNILTNLEISNCSKLSYLDCSSNVLTSLNISKCPELLKNISNNIVAKSNSHLVIIDKGEEVKNLLIVGRTGGGKSTLSNVLTGTDEFKESGASFSITKNFQNKIFKHNGINYRVVDTMGVGDTNLSKKRVLYKIAEGIYSMPEGISHILFVVDGRFTAEEIETFFTFEKAIFESGIVKYITIVRTKFSNFKNKYECEKDKMHLRGESEVIEKIVKKCRDIFYVDNPTVNIINPDDEDLRSIEINKKIRKSSRDRLLDYLEEECQNECMGECHPSKCLKELKEHRQKELEKCLKELQEKSQKDSKELQEKSQKDSKELQELKELEEIQKKPEKLLKEPIPKRLKEELEKHQEKCNTCQRKCHKCENKCYYKLKKWDQLRDEIAVYMKQIESESDNLEAIIDKIAEIAERRLNKEIPALFRAFRKAKEDCSIV